MTKTITSTSANSKRPELTPPFMCLAENTRLGNYIELHAVRHDARGIYYTAIHRENGTAVTIKELMPTRYVYRDPASRTVKYHNSNDKKNFLALKEGFLAAAEQWAEVDHPNLIKVTDSFSKLGTAYYVSPSIEQNKRIPRPAKITEGHLSPILSQLLEGLRYLHGKDMLHLNIEPGSIVLRDDGTPVLTDFGTNSGHQLHDSKATKIVNDYKPIEQKQSKGNIGVWTDLYSLGATCYYFITGQLPPSCLDRIGETDCYRPLAAQQELNERFSTEFLAGIDKALGLWQDDRWQTAADWADSLPPPPPVDETAEDEEEDPAEQSMLIRSVETIPHSIEMPQPCDVRVTESVTVEPIDILESEDEPPIQPASAPATTKTIKTRPYELHPGGTTRKMRLLKLATGLLALQCLGTVWYICQDHRDDCAMAAALQTAKQQNSQLTEQLNKEQAEQQSRQQAAATPMTQACYTLKSMGIYTQHYAEKLISATKDGNLPLMQLLLTAGANANATDKDSHTALYYAIEYANTKAVLILLADPGIDVNKVVGSTPPLVQAIKLNHTKITKLLIEHGADFNSANEYGQCPIHTAARESNVTTTKVLIAAGADIHRTDHNGNSPLLLATEAYNNSVLRLLLEHGADINGANLQGHTALHLAAATHYRTQEAQLLLRYGADVHKTDNKGNTPLHHASSNDCLKIVDLLLYHGADVNCANLEGNTPLHLATADNWENRARFVASIDENVDTCSREELAEALLTAGANVNKKNKAGQTPLHLAAMKQMPAFVSLLLKYNANPNRLNADGKTPLDCTDNEEIKQILIDAGAMTGHDVRYQQERKAAEERAARKAAEEAARKAAEERAARRAAEEAARKAAEERAARRAAEEEAARRAAEEEAARRALMKQLILHPGSINVRFPWHRPTSI